LADTEDKLTCAVARPAAKTEMANTYSFFII